MTSYDKEEVQQNGNNSSHTSSKFFCYNRSTKFACRVCLKCWDLIAETGLTAFNISS